LNEQKGMILKSGEVVDVAALQKSLLLAMLCPQQSDCNCFIYFSTPLAQVMARVEQKYLVDKETVEHLIAMLRDSLARGSSEKEVREQTWEALDSQYRAKTDQALKEMNEGRVKRFKNAEQMIKDLSRW
jgi:hypothetical protein